MPRPGEVLDLDDLTAFVESRLARFKVPTRWVVFDELLPRNAAGRFLKRELRALFADAPLGHRRDPR